MGLGGAASRFSPNRMGHDIHHINRNFMIPKWRYSTLQHHIRPHFVGIFSYIGRTQAAYMVGTSNQSIPEMAIDHTPPRSTSGHFLAKLQGWCTAVLSVRCGQSQEKKKHSQISKKKTLWGKHVGYSLQFPIHELQISDVSQKGKTPQLFFWVTQTRAVVEMTK